MAGPEPSYLLDNLAAAVSPAGDHAPLRGGDLGRVDLHQPAAVAVVAGRIAGVGHPADLTAEHADLPVIDGLGRIAVPGLVDCHTHPAFGGNRANEFDLRSQGAEYERIHAEGGGIRSTVAATRALGRDGLAREVARHFGCATAPPPPRASRDTGSTVTPSWPRWPRSHTAIRSRRCRPFSERTRCHPSSAMPIRTSTS